MSHSELTDRVNPDPKLSGDEKETTLTMYGQDKQFGIFSAKPTIIKSLLKHDHFELEWGRIVGTAEGFRVESRAELEEAEGDIVAIKGKMPIGVLTVKSKPRSNNNQSSIVNFETIDSSVFE